MNSSISILQIIYASFLMSLIILGGIGYFIGPSLAEGKTTDENLVMILVGAGAFFIVFSQAIVNFVFSAQGETHSFRHTRVILGLALREAGAILGLVIAFIGGDPSWCLALVGSAVAYGVIVFPKE